MAPISQSKVAVLLCTYHGQRYLAEQLDSIYSQSHTNWHIWASDDSSSDDTHNILLKYQEKWGVQKLSIHLGPSEGFADNFLSLTCRADIEADYFAYSDQDDIWENDKLERALANLSQSDPHQPLLYCSRTRLVNADNQHIGFSPLFRRPPGFANALLQNVGGGNTMVFNNAARVLLRETRQGASVISHDWWAYLVVSGCGGQVFYDPYPSVRYRQHGGNLVGMDSTWPARISRMYMLWKGQRQHWNDRNIAALQNSRRRLTEENQRILDEFSAARQKPLLMRLIALKNAGVYMQTLMGSLSFFLAAVFKKL